MYTISLDLSNDIFRHHNLNCAMTSLLLDRVFLRMWSPRVCHTSLRAWHLLVPYKSLGNEELWRAGMLPLAHEEMHVWLPHQCSNTV